MAKRFIDTEIFNDDWFMELSKDAKLFYIYYITNCDHAGILKLNIKLAELQTGIKNMQTVIKDLSNCLITLKANVYLMPAFIKYQYPDFPKSNVKQQDSALKILLTYGIDEEKIKFYLTVSKELNNSYVNDSVIDSVIDIEKSKDKKPKFNFELAMQQFGFSEHLITEWMQVRKTKKMTNSETAFYNFVNEVKKINIDKNELLKLIITKSWGGFEAKWYHNQQSVNTAKELGATASFHTTDYTQKL